MKEPFISVLISEEKLNERIAQLGEQISKDYEGKEVKLICILKGSIIFTCELAKRITVPVKFDFMQVSSYGSGTSSSGQIKIKKDLDESIEGEHVIVIEVEVDVKYNGFNIPDEFVVGYGLDYDQSYRNLPFVGVLHLDEEA